MLDKTKTTKITKVIALVLALAFAGSYVPILFGGGLTTTAPTAPPASPSQSAPTTTATTEAQAQALVGQGDISLSSGNFDQAASFYQRAFDAGIGDGALLVKLGRALVGKTDLPGASVKLEEARAADPSLADLHILTAEIAGAQGDSEAEKAAYQAYLDSAPDGPYAEAARLKLAGS